ncbi:MAG: hypothetical protein ACFFDP_06390 [Promethearchaeota archaeon]
MCHDQPHMGFPLFSRFLPGMMCCPGHELSKEARIKRLEAIKAQLKDHLKHLDERIEELQKEKE